jgi:hypothetical protein
MTDDKRGLRALPPALLLAFAALFAMLIADVIVRLTIKEPWTALRYQLTSSGVGFATEVLGALGALELARRLTGRAALGVRIAAGAFIFEVALDVLWALVQFKSNLWDHEWIYNVADYAFWAGWIAIPIGLAIALGRERQVLAIIVVAVALITWPPAFIGKPMYSWLPSGSAGQVINAGFRTLRYGCMLAAFAALAAGQVASERPLAARGLRLAAKSLWVRLVAAAAVPLITLMVIGGKGTEGSVSMLKLATLTALVVNIVALTQFGVGALRVARASVHELGRWPFVLGGACTLWAGGVMLGQLSFLYRMLYGKDSYGGSELASYAQALSIALPIIVAAGMALLAVAIGGFAARSGNDTLRADAQAKGAGFVTLTLVAMAITTWMLPKATSVGSAAMLLLLALGASVVALVMMARLLGLAALDLEREASLPPATLLSDAT